MIGAVLAGGRARRMGGIKPAADLAGRPLISYPLSALRAAGLEPLVVARRETPLPDLDVPVIFDAGEVVHPFTGVVTALDHAGAPIVVLGADMPFVGAALLERLAAREDALVVCRTDALQPLCARYSPSVRDALSRAASAGAPMRATLETLDPVLIDVDPAEVANINTSDDLAAAARLP